MPPLRQWRDLVYLRARLVRQLATEITAQVTPPPQRQPPHHGASSLPPQAWRPPPRPTGRRPLVEVWLRDEDRHLYGQPDRVEAQDGQLVVVDLKSGIGAAADTLAAQHRDQLVFYAGLVHATLGEWPRLALLTAAGSTLDVPYTPDQAAGLREQAVSDREHWNAALERGPASSAPTPPPPPAPGAPSRSSAARCTSGGSTSNRRLKVPGSRVPCLWPPERSSRSGRLTAASTSPLTSPSV